ncbi:MAG: DUF192 domain-containing protein [Geminicoccaceae bacterium]
MTSERIGRRRLMAGGIVGVGLAWLWFAGAVQASELDRGVLITTSGEHSIQVELAITAEQRATGLMHRTDIPPDYGMLFDFSDRGGRVAMWMKNTPTSLDMLFLDESGRIMQIAADTEPYSTEVIFGQGQVYAVLEMVAGSVETYGIATGDRLDHPLFE